MSAPSDQRTRKLPESYAKSKTPDNSSSLYAGVVRFIKSIPPLEETSSKPPQSAHPVFIFFNCPEQSWSHARESFPGEVWATEDIRSLRQMISDFKSRGLEPAVFVGDSHPEEARWGMFTKVNDVMMLAESMPDLNVTVLLLSPNAAVPSPSVLLPDPKRIRVMPLRVLLSAPFESVYEHLDFPSQIGRGQVICQVADGKIIEMPEQQQAQAKDTMNEFAGPYNKHMIVTGHFDAMYEAYRQLVVHVGPGVFTNKLIDLGCGTGHPLWRIVSGLMVPQFLSTAEISAKVQSGELSAQDAREMGHLMRSHLDLLLVDRSPEMLAQARSLLESRIEERDWLKRDLDIRSLAEDVMNLNRGILSGMGFGENVTAIVSMLIHWQPSEGKEAFAKHLASILPSGSTLITMEEYPQTVSPSPYLPKSLADKIHRDLRPITMDDYYYLLYNAGFTPIPSGLITVPIDRFHDYYVSAFIRD